METTLKMTIADRIYNFLSGRKGCIATLKEIYENFKGEHAKETIRARIYTDKKNRFQKVAKGLYMVANKNGTSALLIQGDGRKLEGIENKVVDLIMTDHPWEDKKSNRGGNRCFNQGYEDECFKYTEEDFIQKARVLKDGGFLVECIPTENANNYEYLYELKKMAEKQGFIYYCKVMWMKAKEGACNTGRTTKGTEDVLVFTKGKPRRLSKVNADGKCMAYFTKNIIKGRLDMPIERNSKKKRHFSEKPVPLFEYFVENMTEEYDVVLDQFGGSCNVIEASLNKNRFCVCYEIAQEFIQKAVERYNAIPLYLSDTMASILGVKEEDCIIEIDDEVDETEEELIAHTPEDNVILIREPQEDEVNIEDNNEQYISWETEEDIKEEFEDDIPVEASKFQRDKLSIMYKKLQQKYNLFDNKQIETLKSISDEVSKDEAKILNELFLTIFEKAYSLIYKRKSVILDDKETEIFNKIKIDLQVIFEEKVQDIYLRPFYYNYLYESEDFIKYLIKAKGIKSIDKVRKNLEKFLHDYECFLNGPLCKNKDVAETLTIIGKMLS